ncbi:peptide/nickel transport system permease protein [Microterricola gilva]|uniref:Peptide/nickel transport system permease protein n=1 Tax=Microterricola gilva TaxID=393267 RepID=A0A4Q8APA2_9MICO|nr:ABC transporter permease [Microterricola gilva]RZU66474.1 peptide/nickel transport system permease protein [Microterricola gilva]
MTTYIIRRLFTAIFVLLSIAFFTIALFFGASKDPARAMCGKPCAPDTLAKVRAYMQTDHGIVWQYIEFVKGLFVGRSYGSGSQAVHCAAPCFGYSFPNQSDVTTLIVERLPVTLSLTIGAAILCLVVGLGLGALSAIRKGGVLDRFSTGFAMLGLSVPTFLVGLLVVQFFGFTLNMLPYSGFVPLSENPSEWLWHLIGPWMVLSFILAAGYIRVTRTQLLGELSSEHLVAMTARGAAPSRINAHALRGVMIPVVAMFALDVAALLGGSVIAERVFSLHGLGDLLLSGVNESDLSLVVGVTLFSAFLIIIGNLVADLLMPLLDPRIRRA